MYIYLCIHIYFIRIIYYVWAYIHSNKYIYIYSKTWRYSFIHEISIVPNIYICFLILFDLFWIKNCYKNSTDFPNGFTCYTEWTSNIYVYRSTSMIYVIIFSHIFASYYSNSCFASVRNRSWIERILSCNTNYSGALYYIACIIVTNCKKGFQ